MKVLEMRYEGKAKKVFRTTEPETYLIEYKDDATAFNGAKKGKIAHKGAWNNQITTLLFQKLAGAGIPSHFIRQLDETHMLVKQVEIIPLEVIVRNIASGSMAKRYALTEGMIFNQPVLEFSYKNDALGDPMINTSQALAIGLAKEEEVGEIEAQALAVNRVLKDIFAQAGLDLVDFKLEFGRTADGKILLADEISPDTCRLWDKESGKRLDKDRFRQDLGDVEAAYAEVYDRLKSSTLDMTSGD